MCESQREYELASFSVGKLSRPADICAELDIGSAVMRTRERPAQLTIIT